MKSRKLAARLIARQTDFDKMMEQRRKESLGVSGFRCPGGKPGSLHSSDSITYNTSVHGVICTEVRRLGQD